jgi:hypothetical protein
MRAPGGVDGGLSVAEARTGGASSPRVWLLAQPEEGGRRRLEAMTLPEGLVVLSGEHRDPQTRKRRAFARHGRDATGAERYEGGGELRGPPVVRVQVGALLLGGAGPAGGMHG